MRNLIVFLSLVFLTLLLEGCTPATRIKAPLTAKPDSTKNSVAVDNGTIFQAGFSRPLFEDRRARNVGDVLVITISEVTTASEKSSSNSTTTGSLSLAIPQIQAYRGAAATGAEAVKSTSASDHLGNNVFTGTITVTVLEVLSNGNLLVSGEKMVTVKYSNEFVRFYGVVNPSTISASNTVLSSQVADVRIEYKNANTIDASAISTMVSRLFFSILPF